MSLWLPPEIWNGLGRDIKVPYIFGPNKFLSHRFVKVYFLSLLSDLVTISRKPNVLALVMNFSLTLHAVKLLSPIFLNLGDIHHCFYPVILCNRQVCCFSSPGTFFIAAFEPL